MTSNDKIDNLKLNSDEFDKVKKPQEEEKKRYLLQRRKLIDTPCEDSNTVNIY